ncbi:hypothetical protein QJQ45_006496 [Haematococcus lacustris]|nr:hypothetical protein QJQ45_006496 [Haematococcus lacustris]
MSYVPKNVKDRIALETSLQEAKAHADELQRGRNVANWHVKDARILKTARQARLKELYEREALAYEAELHGMGLSLVKPRQ